MKKDDWIKIFVPSIITWLMSGGVWGLYFMVIDKTFLAIWLGIPIILFAIMLICIKCFSSPEKDRVIEVLKDFINPLIGDLDREIRGISNSLSSEAFTYLLYEGIKPKYKYAHIDVLKNRDVTEIKEKVDKFNRCAKTIKNTATELRGVIGDAIKQRFPKDIMKYSKRDVESLIIYIEMNDNVERGNRDGVYGFWNENRVELLSLREEPPLQKNVDEIKQQLNEAKAIATELRNKLEELREKYMIECGITRETIMVTKEE